MHGCIRRVAYVLAYSGLAEEFEQLQFPKSPQTEHRVVEGGNLLDRNLSSRWAMDSGTNDTVGTLSYDIEDLILRACEAYRVSTKENGGVGENKHGPTLNLTLRGAGCAWEEA
jgi:hypothetical protein